MPSSIAIVPPTTTRFPLGSIQTSSAGDRRVSSGWGSAKAGSAALEVAPVPVTAATKSRNSMNSTNSSRMATSKAVRGGRVKNMGE